MFGWFRSKREATFDPAWESILERNVWQYRHLHAAQRIQMHEVVARMVARKNWEGGAGLKLADEALVTVSGAAALLTLGADEPFDFPHLRTIIVYASSYRAEPRSLGGSSDPIFGGIDFQGEARLGEAWHGGPVVLSWRDVLQTARKRGDGDNLVLHEFAHHLDGLDGPIDGVPFIPDRDERRSWYAVSDAEYQRLVGQASRDEATLLDHYGATNRAEFFAVATECFFEQPHAMRDHHSELYEALSRYYRQSPAEWLPLPAPPANGSRDQRSTDRLTVNLAGLGFEGADAEFARGYELLGVGDLEGAIAALSRAIELDCDDAEAFELRAQARIRLGDMRGVLADAGRAIALAPDNMSARLLYAEAAVDLGRDREAEPHVKKALRADRRDPDALYLDGLLRHRRGDHRGAERSLRSLVVGDNSRADSHSLYADVCESLGQPDKAALHRRRAELLDPETFGR